MQELIMIRTYMLCNTVTMHIIHDYTTEVQRLVNAAVTTRILSIVVMLLVSDGLLMRVIGKVPWRILYFLRSCPITRSTCILTRDS